MSTFRIRRVLESDEAVLEALADVLIDCVEAGASVSFMHPLSRDRALEFWRDVVERAAASERVLLVGEDERGVGGTVQLLFAPQENQPHRADLSKLLVHRRARNRGLGEALMRAAEDAAREFGRTLLVLDTANDIAERLYLRLGWVRVGVIPNFALWPRGGYCATTLFYRELGSAAVPALDR